MKVLVLFVVMTALSSAIVVYISKRTGLLNKIWGQVEDRKHKKQAALWFTSIIVSSVLIQVICISLGGSQLVSKIIEATVLGAHLALNPLYVY